MFGFLKSEQVDIDLPALTNSYFELGRDRAANTFATTLRENYDRLGLTKQQWIDLYETIVPEIESLSQTEQPNEKLDG